jgi:hypothetical protein
MERVSIKLEIADEALTVNEIKRRVKGTSAYTGEAIETLIHEGYVGVADGPNQSKLLSSLRSYREAEDPSCNSQNDSSGSAVRRWFGSGSRITEASSGSAVRGSLDPEPPAPLDAPPENHLEIGGWFGSNGHLTDTELAWLDEITPDPDPDADPNP